jgi:hypothetical protein
MHIGKAFLNDSKDGNVQLGIQRFKAGVAFQSRGNAGALSEAFDILFERRPKP